jgi:hypothetical protein
MLAWADASECDGRHGVLIASLSSEPLFLTGGSERLPASSWQPERPEFFHSRYFSPSKRQRDTFDLRGVELETDHPASPASDPNVKF